jgi:energy-converting hydrogenase Eha subunit E
VLGVFFTRKATRWLLPTVGISTLFLHFLKVQSLMRFLISDPHAVAPEKIL